MTSRRKKRNSVKKIKLVLKLGWFWWLKGQRGKMGVKGPKK